MTLISDSEAKIGRFVVETVNITKLDCSKASFCW